jgi:hypothetical protein
MCDPFRVVMWLMGGGRFPGALPPAGYQRPFRARSAAHPGPPKADTAFITHLAQAQSNKFAPPNAQSGVLKLNSRVK